MLVAGAGWVLYVRSLPAPEPKHPVTPEMLETARREVGREAPRFEGIAGDGKRVTIDPRQTDLPILVLAIKDGCPCSIEVQPTFNALAKLFEGRVRFVGFIDGGRVTASNFERDMKVPFEVLYDPDSRAARAFGMPRSAYSALIGTDGRIVATWPGYSKVLMLDLAASLGPLEPDKGLDVSRLPDEPNSGCEYDLPADGR